MKIIEIKNPAAGNWARDSELISLKLDRGTGTGLEIMVYKDSDKTKWLIQFSGIIAYKVISEEFAIGRDLDLDRPPTDINYWFFEIIDSTWMAEFGDHKDNILKQTHHFVYYCYDDIIEVIAKDFKIKQLL